MTAGAGASTGTSTCEGVTGDEKYPPIFYISGKEMGNEAASKVKRRRREHVESSGTQMSMTTLSQTVDSLHIPSLATMNGLPSPSRDKYRFYQCVLEPMKSTCYEVKPPLPLSDAEGNLRILRVPTWLPSVADRTLIRWKLFAEQRTEFGSVRDNSGSGSSTYDTGTPKSPIASERVPTPPCRVQEVLAQVQTQAP